MNDAITGGAVVGGIIAILFALRPYILPKLRGSSHRDESEVRTGDKDVAFWEKRFDRLEAAIATVDRVMREHRQLTHGEVKDIRDLLVDIDASLKVNLATRQRERQ